MTARACRLVALIALAAGVAAAQEQMLVLKDGRRIPVTRMVRRDGLVVFETTRGERFSVAEAEVVSPPLESIPAYAPPAAEVPAQPQTLVLKDGRRITVLRLVRRGGQVLMQTVKGEAFAVPEDQVVSPALSSIPSLDEPAAPPPAQPEAPPAPPAPTRPPLPPATAEFLPVPRRWDIPFPDSPRIVKGRPLDPYNQSVLKGDKPVIGDDVFLVVSGVLDTPSEVRRLPVGSGVSTADPNSLEFFGRGAQAFTSPRAIVSAELFEGQTAFRPKSWALKATGVFNLNYVATRENNQVAADVREGTTRRRQDAALEEAFGEVKLLDLSPSFDFLSARAGIQPFVSDFRGFLFSDSNLGLRIFGSAAANRVQYNLAVFDLLEKDTNSELNTFERRHQQVLVGNVFIQDFLTLGYTLSLSAHRSQDGADEVHYDRNGFLVRPAKVGTPRPHAVSSNYLGLAGDGHWGRLNVSHALYVAFGTDDFNPIVARRQDIRAGLAAFELSLDRDWARFRLAGLFASGDDDLADRRARGFDSILDFTNFAGGPFSFWDRSGIALVQTGVLLKPPGSLLPDLRSNKFEGQANFVNPGLLLVNAAADVEVTPKLKVVANVNHLWFHRTDTLEELLFQPSIDRAIGTDFGLGLIYRPLLNENVVVVAGGTALVPGGGFDDIYASACGSVPGCGHGKRNLANAFLQLKLTY